MTTPLEVLVYDVTPTDQGHRTYFVARTYPSGALILFDPDHYDDVHMVFHGKKIYQLKRCYWPKETVP